jgi:protein-L-isoaspartate(D-aspartate) O-methyltransferase
MDPDDTLLRQQMVAEQIEARGIHDQRVLDVMRKVPSHLFVAEEYRGQAYADGPLPTGLGQTISQPYIVALMTFLLHLRGNEKVLDVGTGSGYQAAVLAGLAQEVYSIEYFPELAQAAQERLEALGYQNVRVQVGDGTLGLPQFSPYHGILVAAAAPDAPQPLLDQLDLGGRLVIPIGGRGGQNLQVWQRQDDGIQVSDIAPVAFVPLRGSYGWKEEIW